MASPKTSIFSTSPRNTSLLKKPIAVAFSAITALAVLGSACTIQPECSVGSLDPSGLGDYVWVVFVEPTDQTHHLYLDGVYDQTAGPSEPDGDFGSIKFLVPMDNTQPILVQVATEIDGPLTDCGVLVPEIT